MDSLGAKSQHQTPEKTNLKVVATLSDYNYTAR